jgi:hypothetical protein
VGDPTRPDDADDARRAVGAPGSMYIVPGPVLDVRRFDVVVRPTRPLDPPTRTTPFALYTTNKPAELPQASRAVIPLRFLLRMGVVIEREVTVDFGTGPETWRVTVSRLRSR